MDKIKEYIKKYKIYIIISIFVLIIILESIVFMYFYNNKKVYKETKEIKKVDSYQKKEIYYVNIKGEVINPGVYEVEDDMTVNDVIFLAGGLTENADTLPTNLSKKVEDEMVIIIFSKDEVQNFKQVKEELKNIEEKCNCEEYIENNTCITVEGLVEDGKININTATKEELMTLPGIGESKALSIIEYREKNGKFEAIEDVKNISGIGDSLFDKIKENITV